MTSRRDFLKTTGSAMIGAACIVKHPRTSEAHAIRDVPLKTYKSLKWGMIRVEGSTVDKFRMLRRLGYDGVEIDSPLGVDPDEALAASQEIGLPVEGVVNSTHWKVRHSDPDPKVRAQAVKNMRTAMRTAEKVGADSVLLVPGG